MAQHEAEDVEMKGAAGRLSQAKGNISKSAKAGQGSIHYLLQTLAFHSIPLHCIHSYTISRS
jgi:hypothetical protein